MITFTVEGELKGDVVETYVKDNVLRIGLLGTEYPTPEEILLASALSCLILTVYYIAKERDIKIDSIDGYIEGTLDPKGFEGDPSVPPGILEVNYFIDVKSEEPKIEEVLREAEKRCPLRDTLVRSVKVKVNWNIKS